MIKTDNQSIQLSLVDDFYEKKTNVFAKMCDMLGCDTTQPAWTDYFGKSL
jgi:hypothetical protein